MAIPPYMLIPLLLLFSYLFAGIICVVFFGVIAELTGTLLIVVTPLMIGGGANKTSVLGDIAILGT